ncbi:MAG: FAD binding domain-containing protein [Planctomycetota bacterium]|nr:FAD binding domain-containing protein [Planctomycetota bacterium]
MKSFDYAEPRTESEVVALLSEHDGHAEVLAGGTDLVGLMKKMIIKPDLVVNIMEVESLQSMGPQQDGSFSIGAAVTLDDLLAHPYLENYPAISDAILGINSMQLQAQGTIGGEICQKPRCWYYRNGQGLLDQESQVSEGDNRLHAILGNQGPAKFVSSSRIGPALIALDAQLRIVGPGDQQHFVPVADFFVTPRHADQRETTLGADQLLTHILLPARDNSFNATYEVRHGEGPDYPLAAAAASLEISTSGRVEDALVVLGQVAPTPWISHEAAQTLVGSTLNESLAEAAGDAAVLQATPLSDNEYKVQLARVAVKRAILRAAGFETGGF